MRKTKENTAPMLALTATPLQRHSANQMREKDMYEPGDRIRFDSEKMSYKIIAASDRYLICTRPYNPQRTYQYTIVDLVDKMRGPDNMLLGPLYDYDDKKEAEKALIDLENGELSLSPRRSKELVIAS